MKAGEKLVRTLIAELNERLSTLEKQTAEGRIGPHYYRYRLRWLRRDYDKMESIARRWGFKTAE